ncbi:MAG: redox-sensing transcriptional repressor Rex [bacterium]
MKNQLLRGVPQPTLRRLAQYHHRLKQMEAMGRDTVSCTTLAADLKLAPTQIRKDLEFTTLTGQAGVGFGLGDLIHSIETVLGWDNTTDAVLAGAGSLGTALLGYERFTQIGLNIIAGFEIDSSKVGLKIHGKTILPLDKLTNLVQRMKIKIGILTVPAEVAQTVTNLMLAGGIRAIWNFAPVILEAPADVVVENVSLASSYAVLSNRLLEAAKTQTNKENNL